MEKAASDYGLKHPGPPEAWLWDVVRGRVICDRIAQMAVVCDLIKAIAEEMGGGLVRFKNRLQSPTAHGYRDLLLSVRLRVRRPGMSGSFYHVCEVQVQHLAMVNALDETLKAHDVYSASRGWQKGDGVLKFAGLIGNGMNVSDATERICEDFIAEVDELNAYGAIDALDLEAQDAVSGILMQGRGAGAKESARPQHSHSSHRSPHPHSPKGPFRDKRPLLPPAKASKVSLLSSKASSSQEEKLHLSSRTGPSAPQGMATLQDEASWQRMRSLFSLLLDDLGNLPCALKAATTLRECAESAIRLQEGGLQLEAIDSEASRLRHHQLAISKRRLGLSLAIEAKAFAADGKRDRAGRAGRRAVLLFRRLTTEEDASAELFGARDGGRTSLGILVSDCMSTLGDVESAGAAAPLLEEAFQIALSLLGHSHPRTARALDELCLAQKDAGDLEKAHATGLRALEARRSALGDQHISVAKALNVLGSICQGLGRFPEARQHFDEALQVMREVAGERHVETAYVLNNMGTMEFYRGDYEEAAQLHFLAAGILSDFPKEGKGVAVARKNGNRALKLSLKRGAEEKRP